ncbi:LADA_0H00320g1_1 [Lachancea dasiensis]|uniref:LADA_0H00320g1_1 n=1 Tax=Lachancea dasiensis TaxID=1072105 RepID=A0A1G4JYQ6_9SACH|nr:LADA_0H00320g1_1 [Lachancea dasiensis]
MASKGSVKKSGKSSTKKMAKSRITKQQKIKTKLQVEQANKKAFLISDLNQRDGLNSKSIGSKSLKLNRLLEDQQKDKHTQESLAQQKKDTESDMVQQLELISGVSL